jgi:hypothetical protein
LAADGIPWEREDIVTPIKAFIEKHPVLTYYALVFAISWGGILMLVAPGGIPGEPEEVARLFPFTLAALFAGPSVAGVVTTALERTPLENVEPFRNRPRAVRHHLPAKAEHDVNDVGEHRQKSGQPCDDVEATRVSERADHGGHETCSTAR